MPTGPRPSQESYAALRAPAIGSALFEGFCRTFFKIYSPLTVEGQHRLPDEPFLLCSNHCSHADSAVLMTASGRRFRDFALLGASDYFFQSRGMRWTLSPLMNVIPIERHPGSRSLAACREECLRFLTENGRILILYPEGTRSPDGEMREFKSGVGWLANELRVPLVPAYIEGTHRILAKGHSVPRPYSVNVRFGEALLPEQVASPAASEREKRHAIAEALACKIRLLMPAHADQEFSAEMRDRSRI